MPLYLGSFAQINQRDVNVVWAEQSPKVTAPHRQQLMPPNQPPFTSATDPDSLWDYAPSQFPKQSPDSEFPYELLATPIMLWGFELTGPRSQDQRHQFYRQYMGTGSSSHRIMVLLETTGIQALLKTTDGSQVTNAFLRYYEITPSTGPCGSDTTTEVKLIGDHCDSTQKGCGRHVKTCANIEGLATTTFSVKINGETFEEEFVTESQLLNEISGGAQPCLVSTEGEKLNVHINHKVTLNVPASENENSLEAFKKLIDQKEFKRLCLLTDMKLPGCEINSSLQSPASPANLLLITLRSSPNY